MKPTSLRFKLCINHFLPFKISLLFNNRRQLNNVGTIYSNFSVILFCTTFPSSCTLSSQGQKSRVM